MTLSIKCHCLMQVYLSSQKLYRHIVSSDIFMEFYLVNDEQGVNSSMTFFVKNISRRGEKATKNSPTQKTDFFPALEWVLSQMSLRTSADRNYVKNVSCSFRLGFL